MIDIHLFPLIGYRQKLSICQEDQIILENISTSPMEVVMSQLIALWDSICHIIRLILEAIGVCRMGLGRLLGCMLILNMLA